MKFTKEELVDLVRISKTDIFNELTNDELVDGWLSDKEIKDSERQTDHESQDTGEPSNEILADVISRLSLIEIENAVQLLHYEDDEYGNTKARCEELLEQTRNKIGYTKADFLACL